VFLTTENMKITIFWDVVCPYQQACMPSSHKTVIFIQWNFNALGMKTFPYSDVYIICWYIHLAMSAYEKAFSILPYPALHFPCNCSLFPCLLWTVSLIWYLHLFLHFPTLPLCNIFNFSIHRNFVIDITQTIITFGFLCLKVHNFLLLDFVMLLSSGLWYCINWQVHINVLVKLNVHTSNCEFAHKGIIHN